MTSEQDGSGWQLSWVWQEIATELTAIGEWSHSGVAELLSGAIAVSTPGAGSVSLILPDRIDTIQLGRGIFHGIASDVTGKNDYLWLADIGSEQQEARIVLLDVAAGTVVDHSPSKSELPGVISWRPTSIAVERSISDKHGYVIWVADGYGNSEVHRIESGRVTLTIDGSSSGLRFDCPHGVALDTRFEPPRLVVADRNNQRLAWFDLDGDFIRSLDDPRITSPSSLVVSGSSLFVTELHGGLISVSPDFQVADVLPRSPLDRAEPWPNAGDPASPKRPELRVGLVNSPHGICRTQDGSLVITEWLIGGRAVKLTPII